MHVKSKRKVVFDMIQRGVVVGVRNENGHSIAMVEASRKSACDGCAKKSCDGGDCKMSDLVEASSSKKMTASAENSVGAKVGDIVEIETDSKVVLKYAAIVFLFPVIAAFAFFYIAGKIFSAESVPYIAALLGFAASFVVIYFTAEKKTKKKLDIRVVRVIN
jgi:Positive regulator of sigma E activity